MKRMKSLGFAIAGAAIVVWACGGSSENPIGSGDGGGGTSSGVTSSGGTSSGTASGGGTSSSGTSSGATSSSGTSSGATSSSGGAVVTGDPFVCGTGANATVCNPPDVCCGGGGGGGGPGGGGGGAKCEAQSSCTTGVAESCTADSCPEDGGLVLCCADITVGTTGGNGTTACQVGSCGSGLQLCSTNMPCPSGETCEALTGAGGGGGAGGGIEVCRTGGNTHDGGVFHFDAGGFNFDAGGFGFDAGPDGG